MGITVFSGGGGGGGGVFIVKSSIAYDEGFISL